MRRGILNEKRSELVRMPRILYVCPDEGIDIFGTRGCSTHVREICRAFKSLGCDLKLLLAGECGPPDSAFDIEHEMVAPFRSKKLGYDVRKVLTNRRLLKRLQELVVDFRPDLIYERYDLYSAATARVASGNEIPYLLEVNAPLIDEQRDILHFPRIAATYQRHTFCKADLLIGVSDEICSMLKRIAPNSRVLLVENGVNEEVFDAGVSGAGVRERHGLNDQMVVGFVGSLKGWQGVRTLIRAASVLLAQRDNLSFLVVGGGNNLPIYKQLVNEARLQERFSLIRPAHHAEIPSYIAAFDICVAPYDPMPKFYFSPIKLAEYISMRKAIVASDVPAIRKNFRHGVDALLAKPGDAQDLAAKIGNLLDEPALRERLARSAHERFAGNLSWSNCAQKILEAAEDIPRRESS